jgi:hypothetical protein
MKAILLATVAAIAVQPLVLFAWLFLPALIAGDTVPPKDLVGMSLFSALLASPFVVVVGIPAFLLLRYFRHLSWWSLGTIGLVVAACPVAVFGLFEYAGYSSGGNWYGTPVEFVINGQKTFYGWLSYAQSVVFFGLHGFVGALAFFIVWRRSLGPNHSFEADGSAAAQLQR